MDLKQVKTIWQSRSLESISSEEQQSQKEAILRDIHAKSAATERPSSTYPFWFSLGAAASIAGMFFLSDLLLLNAISKMTEPVDFLDTFFQYDLLTLLMS